MLIALANILDEDQNDKLMADNSVFDFLIRILKRAMMNSNRRYDGLSVEEVVDGMSGLAKNDANKSLLVEKGVLPLLMEVMRESTNTEEVMRAVKCVWQLSFDKKNKKDFNVSSDTREVYTYKMNKGLRMTT